MKGLPFKINVIIFGFVCLSLTHAKKKVEVDPAEVRKFNAEISRLKKENQKLTIDLSHVDSMTSEESARTRKLHQNYTTELARKKEEIQTLKNKQQSLQNSIHKEKSKQANYENKSGEIKARLKADSKLLGDLIEELENTIQKYLECLK